MVINFKEKKGSCTIKIGSDHGKEFENAKFFDICSSKGISHVFSSPITPQQNKVVERKKGPYKNQQE